MNKIKYIIEFYTRPNGDNLSYDYIVSLAKKRERSKDTRIKYNKIIEYLNLLKYYGTTIREPYIKQIINSEYKLYELRPLRDRFFFIFEDENKYIILNHFVKSTEKTPKKEIEKAIRLIKERETNEKP